MGFLTIKALNGLIQLLISLIHPLTYLFYSESKGRMLHLLKQKSKVAWKPKNRKKFEPLLPTPKKLKEQKEAPQDMIVDQAHPTFKQNIQKIAAQTAKNFEKQIKDNN